MRIALVDPSRAVQRAMTEIIAPGEHEVVAFNAGKKALDCIGMDDRVRALITSVQLEDISGIQLCAAARKLVGPRRALFIIIMSSTEDYGLVVQALDNGADDFIRKPPFPEELRARTPSSGSPHLDAARLDQICHNRFPHRAAQSTSLFRGCCSGVQRSEPCKSSFGYYI